MKSYKFKYQYSEDRRFTVTVTASNRDQARVRAWETLDRRYEKQGKEPPVGYTLRLITKQEIK